MQDGWAATIKVLLLADLNSTQYLMAEAHMQEALTITERSQTESRAFIPSCLESRSVYACKTSTICMEHTAQSIGTHNNVCWFVFLHILPVVPGIIASDHDLKVVLSPAMSAHSKLWAVHPDIIQSREVRNGPLWVGQESTRKYS